MTCAQMGGPATCNVAVTGNTADEMAKNGGAHLMSATDDAHKPMQEVMKSGSKEDQAKWMADFMPKFDAAPQM